MGCAKNFQIVVLGRFVLMEFDKCDILQIVTELLNFAYVREL
jgi:hypothetical protein